MSEPTNTTPATVAEVMAQLAEADKARAEPQLTSRQRRARTVARQLHLIQGLNGGQAGDCAGEGVDSVVREFRNHRFDADIDGAPLAEADEDWFAAVVHGVVEDQRAVDEAVKARLASNWRLERLDATLRALLRCGAWELKHKPDVPREIVIDEYVELAKAFFDDAEAKFVNAALDGVARDARD